MISVVSRVLHNACGRMIGKLQEDFFSHESKVLFSSIFSNNFYRINELSDAFLKHFPVISEYFPSQCGGFKAVRSRALTFFEKEKPDFHHFISTIIVIGFY